jgi:hypothetical protein
MAVEELAVRFQQTYLATLGRVQINNTGGLLVSRDVDAYIRVFEVRPVHASPSVVHSCP